MKDKCTWCGKGHRIEAQVAGSTMPVLCKDCGTHMGWIDWEELNKIIVERDYYKKEFYKRVLTNQK